MAARTLKGRQCADSARRALMRARPPARSGACRGVISVKNGAPGAIRTRDLSLRRPILYPAELRAHIQIVAISFLTRRSALAHCLVIPLNVRINGLLEAPDFPVFSALSQPHSTPHAS